LKPAEIASSPTARPPENPPLKSSPKDAANTELNFRDDIRAGRYRRPLCDHPAIFRKAADLSSAHAIATKCRSLDLLHVAAAAILGCRALATFDTRQAAAAKKAGLAIVSK